MKGILNTYCCINIKRTSMLLLIINIIIVFLFCELHIWVSINDGKSNINLQPAKVIQDIQIGESVTSVDILFCCNDHSKPGLYALINSIIIHHTFKLNEYLYFHILVESNSHIYEKEFELLFSDFIRNESIFIKYEFQSFSNYKTYYLWHKKHLTHGRNKHLTNVMNYARFYLPVIFKDIENIAIYLDIDVIVLNDISLLIQNIQTNNECVLMGVFDSKETYIKMFKLKHKKAFESLGLNLGNINVTNTFGFNAGVVVYNLSYWRLNNHTAKYEYIFKLNEKLQGGLFKSYTQPIMNVLYSYRIVNSNKCALDPYWNSRGLGVDRLSVSRWMDISENANIMHWTGRFKPWIKNQKIQKYWHADAWRKFLPRLFASSCLDCLHFHDWTVCN